MPDSLEGVLQRAGHLCRRHIICAENTALTGAEHFLLRPCSFWEIMLGDWSVLDDDILRILLIAQACVLFPVDWQNLCFMGNLV